VLASAYLPHNGAHQFHHDLVEDVEEVQHELGLLPHLAHDDAEGHEEADQTCGSGRGGRYRGRRF